MSATFVAYAADMCSFFSGKPPKEERRTIGHDVTLANSSVVYSLNITKNSM